MNDKVTEKLNLPFEMDLRDCTGCMACREICPKGAITGREDPEGFCFPECDAGRCVGCGLCERTCPAQNPVDGYEILKSDGLLLRLNDKKHLLRSASGGAFYGIARFIIEQKHGYVFGAAYNGELAVVHIGVDRIGELFKLQNSKYVQSAVGDSYRQVRDLLGQGRWVFFTGTPCQVAGLKAYLGKDYEHLITADIICHGVPSPKLLRYEMRSKEKELGAAIVACSFRNKGKYTRSNFILKVRTNSGGGYKLYLKNTDLYYSLFLSGASFRESCYTCWFASSVRMGDFTIGDNDSHKDYPDFHPDESNSVCLIHTEKGRMLWEEGIRELFDTHFLDVGREAEANKQLKAPSLRPELRDRIYREIEKYGYDEVAGKYCDRPSLKSRLKARLKLLFPSAVLRRWKRILKVLI